jgi:hypothetical protein
MTTVFEDCVFWDCDFISPGSFNELARSAHFVNCVWTNYTPDSSGGRLVAAQVQSKTALNVSAGGWAGKAEK